jgi:hypothetical protein
MSVQAVGQRRDQAGRGREHGHQIPAPRCTEILNKSTYFMEDPKHEPKQILMGKQKQIKMVKKKQNQRKKLEEQIL